MKKKFFYTAGMLVITAGVLMFTVTGCASLTTSLRTLINPDKQLPDDGITSDLHKANIGKIIFSSSVIELENPDAAALKSSFTQDDYIFGRFYLSESLQNHIYHEQRIKKDYPKYSYNVYIDNELQNFTLYKGASMPEDGITTRQLKIRVKRTEAGWGETGEWVKFVNSTMTPGKHLVKLELKSEDTGKVVAAGEFTYEKKEKPALYGTTFADYTAGKTDKTLEKNMLETIKKKFVSDKETWTGLKIKSEDWFIMRDELGNITSRVMEAWAQFKKSDGTVWVQKFLLGQEYDGNGYLSSFLLLDYENAEEVDE